MAAEDHDSEERAQRGGARGALLRYAIAWSAAAALLVLAAFALRDEAAVEPPWLQAGATTAPPPRTASLSRAADAAGCTLQHVRRQGYDDLIRRPTTPPTFGPPVPRAAPPGVYARPPRIFQVVGALRRGTVVVQFRRDLPEERLQLLRAVHDESPDGAILMPDGRGMPYEVAATAWRRLLACASSADEDVIDAIRAFRTRFRGQGPDA